MYDRIINAIEKRAGYDGFAYVEDYGSSIHKTAKVTFDDTLEAICKMEDLGWLISQKSPAGFPVKVKMVRKTRECKEYVANIRKELINALNHLTPANTGVAQLN